MWNNPRTFNRLKMDINDSRMKSFLSEAKGGTLLEVRFSIDYNGPVWQTYLTNWSIYIKDNKYALWTLTHGSITSHNPMPTHIYANHVIIDFIYAGADSYYSPMELYDQNQGAASWSEAIRDATVTWLRNNGFGSERKAGNYLNGVKESETTLYQMFYDLTVSHLNNALGTNTYKIDWEEFLSYDTEIIPTITPKYEVTESNYSYDNEPYVDRFGKGALNTPEWFQGAFPDTKYHHMVFWDGRSFYIPNGMQVHERATRVYSNFGYIAVRAVIDVVGNYAALLPMQSTVSYGKWSEYMPPDPVGASELWHKYDNTKGVGLRMLMRNQAFAEAQGLKGTYYTGLLANPKIISTLEESMILGKKMEKTDLFNLAKMFTGG